MAVREWLWPVYLPADGNDTLALSLFCVAAVVIWIHAYHLDTDSFRRRDLRREEPGRQAQSVLAARYSSGALMGVSTLAFAFFVPGGLGAIGLGAPRLAPTAAWVALLALAAVPISLSSLRQPEQRARYPEIRTSEWSFSLRVRSAGAWLFYLFGYELLFRGLLVLAAVPLLGTWAGLGVATAIYAVSHLRKGAGETLACVPMGLAFGVMAIQTNSVIGPWLVHAVIALSVEALAIRLGGGDKRSDLAQRSSS